MANHLHFAQIRKIGPVTAKGRVHGGRRDIFSRQGKAGSPLFAPLPQQRFVEDQTVCALGFHHGVTSCTSVSMSLRDAVSVAHSR